MGNVNVKLIASAMVVGWAACALAVGRTGALAGERDLRPLEMWGGRKAHPAVVHSVTAIPGDPWTLSLRGEWEIVQNRLSPSRGNGGRANTGREGFWKTRTIHRVQVPGCLEDVLKDVHSEPEKGRSWFCAWDCSPILIRGFHYGETWYRKAVKLPTEWKGRRIWLKTGWTNSQGYFWINGKYVAFDWYGCETFKYDVTDLVKPGEREEMVVVQVNNAAPSHRGNINSKNHWTGILRDVEFEATPADRWIDDAWARGGRSASLPSFAPPSTGRAGRPRRLLRRAVKRCCASLSAISAPGRRKRRISTRRRSSW